MREGRGLSEVRPPLSIMMTANERMGGWGLLSGIISLDHYEKGDNGNLPLSKRNSDAINSQTDEKNDECLGRQGLRKCCGTKVGVRRVTVL